MKKCLSILIICFSFLTIFIPSLGETETIDTGDKKGYKELDVSGTYEIEGKGKNQETTTKKKIQCKTTDSNDVLFMREDLSENKHIYSGNSGGTLVVGKAQGSGTYEAVIEKSDEENDEKLETVMVHQNGKVTMNSGTVKNFIVKGGAADINGGTIGGSEEGTGLIVHPNDSKNNNEVKVNAGTVKLLEGKVTACTGTPYVKLNCDAKIENSRKLTADRDNGAIITNKKTNSDMNLTLNKDAVAILEKASSIEINSDSARNIDLNSDGLKNITLKEKVKATVIGGEIKGLTVDSGASAEVKGGTVTRLANSNTGADAASKVKIKGGTVTVIDGKVTVPANAGAITSLAIGNDASADIEGGTVTSLTGNNDASKVNITGGSVTVTGGKVTVPAGAIVEGLKISEDACVKIKGGTITNNSKVSTIDIREGNVTVTKGNVIVESGGTQDTIESLTIEKDASAEIKGGTIKSLINNAGTNAASKVNITGGNVTVTKGEVTVSAGENNVSLSIGDSASADIKSGKVTVTRGKVTVPANAGEIKSLTIGDSASADIEGGTVKSLTNNNTGEDAASKVNIKGGNITVVSGKVTTANGAIINSLTIKNNVGVEIHDDTISLSSSDDNTEIKIEREFDGKEEIERIVIKKGKVIIDGENGKIDALTINSGVSSVDINSGTIKGLMDYVSRDKLNIKGGNVTIKVGDATVPSGGKVKNLVLNTETYVENEGTIENLVRILGGSNGNFDVGFFGNGEEANIEKYELRCVEYSQYYDSRDKAILEPENYKIGGEAPNRIGIDFESKRNYFEIPIGLKKYPHYFYCDIGTLTVPYDATIINGYIDSLVINDSDGIVDIKGGTIEDIDNGGTVNIKGGTITKINNQGTVNINRSIETKDGRLNEEKSELPRVDTVSSYGSNFTDETTCHDKESYKYLSDNVNEYGLTEKAVIKIGYDDDNFEISSNLSKYKHDFGNKDIRLIGTDSETSISTNREQGIEILGGCIKVEEGKVVVSKDGIVKKLVIESGASITNEGVVDELVPKSGTNVTNDGVINSLVAESGSATIINNELVYDLVADQGVSIVNNGMIENLVENIRTIDNNNPLNPTNNGTINKYELKCIDDINIYNNYLHKQQNNGYTVVENEYKQTGAKEIKIGMDCDCSKFSLQTSELLHDYEHYFYRKTNLTVHRGRRATIKLKDDYISEKLIVKGGIVNIEKGTINDLSVSSNGTVNLFKSLEIDDEKVKTIKPTIGGDSLKSKVKEIICKNKKAYKYLIDCLNSNDGNIESSEIVSGTTIIKIEYNSEDFTIAKELAGCEHRFCGNIGSLYCSDNKKTVVTLGKTNVKCGPIEVRYGHVVIPEKTSIDELIVGLDVRLEGNGTIKKLVRRLGSKLTIDNSTKIEENEIMCEYYEQYYLLTAEDVENYYGTINGKEPQIGIYYDSEGSFGNDTSGRYTWKTKLTSYTHCFHGNMGNLYVGNKTNIYIGGGSVNVASGTAKVRSGNVTINGGTIEIPEGADVKSLTIGGTGSINLTNNGTIQKLVRTEKGGLSYSKETDGKTDGKIVEYVCASPGQYTELASKIGTYLTEDKTIGKIGINYTAAKFQISSSLASYEHYFYENCTGNLVIAKDSTGGDCSCTATIKGGNTTSLKVTLEVTKGSDVKIESGKVTVTSGEVTVPENAGIIESLTIEANASANIIGGTVKSLTTGADAASKVNIRGGNVTVTKGKVTVPADAKEITNLEIAEAADANTIVDINGGTVKSLTNGSNNATVNIRGGDVKVTEGNVTVPTDAGVITSLTIGSNASAEITGGTIKSLINNKTNAGGEYATDNVTVTGGNVKVTEGGVTIPQETILDELTIGSEATVNNKGKIKKLIREMDSTVHGVETIEYQEIECKNFDKYKKVAETENLAEKVNDDVKMGIYYGGDSFEWKESLSSRGHSFYENIKNLMVRDGYTAIIKEGTITNLIAQNGSTVTVEGGTVGNLVNNNNDANKVNIEGGTVTVTSGGVTVPAKPTKRESGEINVTSLTIKDGASTDIKGGTVESLTIGEGASADIRGGTVKSLTNSNTGADAASKVNIRGGDVTVINGSVTVPADAKEITDLEIAEAADANTIVDIKGGTVKSLTNGSNDAKVNIRGGDVTVINGSVTVPADAKEITNLEIAEAAGANTIVDINGGIVKSLINGSNNAKVNVTGGNIIVTKGGVTVPTGTTGTVDRLLMESGTSAQINEGTITKLIANGESNVTIAGGTIKKLTRDYEANITKSGGTVEEHEIVCKNTGSYTDLAEKVKKDKHYLISDKNVIIIRYKANAFNISEALEDYKHCFEKSVGSLNFASGTDTSPKTSKATVEFKQGTTVINEGTYNTPAIILERGNININKGTISSLEVHSLANATISGGKVTIKRGVLNVRGDATINTNVGTYTNVVSSQSELTGNGSVYCSTSFIKNGDGIFRGDLSAANGITIKGKVLEGLLNVKGNFDLQGSVEDSILELDGLGSSYNLSSGTIEGSNVQMFDLTSSIKSGCTFIDNCLGIYGDSYITVEGRINQSQDITQNPVTYGLSRVVIGDGKTKVEDVDKNDYENNGYKGALLRMGKEAGIYVRAYCDEKGNTKTPESYLKVNRNGKLIMGERVKDNTGNDITSSENVPRSDYPLIRGSLTIDGNAEMNNGRIIDTELEKEPNELVINENGSFTIRNGTIDIAIKNKGNIKFIGGKFTKNVDITDGVFNLVDYVYKGSESIKCAGGVLVIENGDIKVDMEKETNSDIDFNAAAIEVSGKGSVLLKNSSVWGSRCAIRVKEITGVSSGKRSNNTGNESNNNSLGEFIEDQEIRDIVEDEKFNVYVLGKDSIIKGNRCGIILLSGILEFKEGTICDSIVGLELDDDKQVQVVNENGETGTKKTKPINANVEYATIKNCVAGVYAGVMNKTEEETKVADTAKIYKTNILECGSGVDVSGIVKDGSSAATDASKQEIELRDVKINKCTNGAIVRGTGKVRFNKVVVSNSCVGYKIIPCSEDEAKKTKPKYVTIESNNSNVIKSCINGIDIEFEVDKDKIAESVKGIKFNNVDIRNCGIGLHCLYKKDITSNDIYKDKKDIIKRDIMLDNTNRKLEEHCKLTNKGNRSTTEIIA